MATVYANAALTIAASASQESHGGCYRPTPQLSGSNSWEIAVEYRTTDDDSAQSIAGCEAFGLKDTKWNPEGAHWFGDDEMADHWEQWRSGGQVLSTFSCSTHQSSTRYLPGFAPPATLPTLGTSIDKISEVNRDRTIDGTKRSRQAKKPPSFLGKIELLEHTTGVYVRELISHQEFASNRSGVFPSTQPLASRAWALQERLLSTRILHFTSSELVWECKSECYCQCGLMGCDAQWGIGSDWPSAKSLKLAFDHAMREASAGNPSQIEHMWTDLAKIYTSKSLSHETDLLPAVSGLIKRLQQAIPGECFAGMWRKYLPEHMTWSRSWFGIENARHEKYVAPTWSWASITKGVWFPKTLDCAPTPGLTVPKPNTVGEIIDVRYTLAGLDPTGSLSKAILTIRAPVMPAMLLIRREETKRPDAIPESKNLVFEIQQLHNRVHAEFKPDSVSDIDTSIWKQDVLCVQWTKQADLEPILAKCRALDWSGLDFSLFAQFLVLRKSTKQLHKHERIGVVNLCSTHEEPDYRPVDEQPPIDRWFRGATICTLDVI